MAMGMPGEARAGLAAVVVGQQVYLLGGHNGEAPVKLVELFEPNTEDLKDRGKWEQMPDMLARRSYLSASALGTTVYAVGGSADGRTLNTFEVFDALKQEWEMWFCKPPMQVKRTRHAGAIIGDRLFIVGGFDGLRDLSVVECYDPKTNSWSRKSPLQQARSYLTLVVAGDCIYALGGQDRAKEAGPTAHREVECFDMYSERWMPGPSLNTGRVGPAAGSLVTRSGEEFIFCCGGSNGDEVLATVERLNVKEGVWTEVAKMGVPRCQHAVVVVNGKLYAIGGFDGKEPLETFECYDPEIDAWGPLLKMGAEKVDPHSEVPQAVVQKFHSCVRWGKPKHEIEASIKEAGVTMTEAVKAKDEKNGNYALNISAQNGNIELTKFLLSKKANINAQNANGQTALHMSVEYDFHYQTKFLLDANADIGVKNNDGHDAITGIDGGKVDGDAWNNPVIILKASNSKEEIDSALHNIEQLEDTSVVDKAALVQVGMQKRRILHGEWDHPRFMTLVKSLA